MEEKATKVPATSSSGRSNEVVKRVSKLEFLKLDKRVKPYIEENAAASRAAIEAVKNDWVR